MSMTPAQAVDDFLARCNPKPIPKEEELRRVRLQITGMSEFALRAAETKSPGFMAMLDLLHTKESKLSAIVEGE
jgi:hypothetical protein